MICLLISLLSCTYLNFLDTVDTNSSISAQESTCNQNYVRKRVDATFIEGIGGPNSLSQYQYYLSGELVLQRVDKTISNTSHGNALSVDNENIIVFTKDTPGVLKEFVKEYQKNNRRNIIKIYFDEGENDYLEFEEDVVYPVPSQRVSHGYSLVRFGSHTVYYKGIQWTIKGNPYITLMVEIRESNTINVEKAKGRTLR